MKYLLTVLIISVLSCNSKKEDTIIPGAEAYLKEQMKDPTSFQVINTKIVDTTMMSEYLKSEYASDTSMISYASSESKADVYRSSAERWLNKIKDLKQDSVYYITVNIEYRAKNGFGALDKGSQLLNYYPGDNSFKILD